VAIKELARRNELIVYDARYRFNLALLSNPRLTDESFDKKQEAAVEIYHDIVGSVRPWEGGYVKQKQAEIKTARQDYIEAFGVDPSSPEFLAWEAERIAAIRAENEQTVETAEQQVMRRMRERRKQQGR
jgi:hypothetical protein